jgi:hypothetical protein
VHRAAEESFKKIIMLKKKTVLAIKKGRNSQFPWNKWRKTRIDIMG